MNDHKAKPLPALEELRRLFSYDPTSGMVRRLIAGSKIAAGAVVGTKNSGGALICRTHYRIVYVHRIAWALHYGEDAPAIIDHINGVRDDNRIVNLRAATAQQNNWNRRAHRSSKSQIKGAHWSSSERKWRSSIKVSGKYLHLGWFKSKEGAAAAYRAAELAHYGEFARVG